MKVLSLTQPWASLVVMGAKKIETRSWNTKYRGPLLIHASKGMYYGKTPNRISCRELLYKEPFSDYIKARDYDQLPFGKIIGSVDLITTFISELSYSGEGIYYQKWGAKFSEQEIAFGDYSPDRYGWLLANPKQFTNPIPAKGSLSLWDYTIADNEV